MTADTPRGSTSTGRVEAFSDGVMAIAITLLVLDLHVPTAQESAAAGGLLPALASHWPSYVAYLASYISIGIIWLNHHALINSIARFDKVLHWANLILLLGVATLPFTTALLAAYIEIGGPDASIAAAVYGATALVMALPWSVIWRHLEQHPELLETGYDASDAQRALRWGFMGPVVYAAATAIALFAPLVALLLYVAIAAFFAAVRQAD